jgi:hypothetical protein
MRKLTILAFAALSACATGYHSGNFTGGFEEIALAPNVYQVSFAGNGFTSAERVQAMVLLRSADLTLQKGFRYFGIADASTSSKLATFTSPTTTNTTFDASVVGNSVYGTANLTTYGGNTTVFVKPSAKNLVVMFNDPPANAGMIFDAQFICQSVGAKLKAQCGHQ